MKPLVSILIPAYNSGEWITQTIESALAQSWLRKEIIVVDDGSKDETLSVARRFESAQVQVVTQPNQGAAAARNKAISLSQGDYIQWLDADDLLHPEKISDQLGALMAGPEPRTLLSGAWGHFSHSPERARFVPTELWNDLQPVDWLIHKLSRNLFMQTGSWLVSRELSNAAGPWDTQMLSDDDGEYFCRILQASSRVCFVPTAKVYYRESGAGSLSVIGGSTRKIEALWVSMQRHIECVRSLEDSPRVREACLVYLRSSFPYFYPEHSSIVEQAQALAVSLGGRLDPPSMSWKYGWIRAAFGWKAAKNAQVALPQFRGRIARSWDKVLFQGGGRKSL
ncbi:MAG: glycosyltransferase [Bryobacteraceae bacterium]